MDPNIEIIEITMNSNYLHESLNEEVSQMSQKEIQEYVNVQEEVVMKECPKDEIIIQNQDINQSFDT